MEDLEIIYSYSRAQAIEDGVLIDVTETVKKAGIIYPTAITNGLYSQYIVPEPILQESEDTINIRILSVLYSLISAIKESKKNHSYIFFTAPIVFPNGQHVEARLWASVGGGDNGEPVITVMLEGED